MNKDECRLVQAAMNGNLQQVKELLDSRRIDVNAMTRRGNTALMFAARNGHTDVVNTILENTSANPALRNRAGKSAYELAIESGHESTAASLPQHAAVLALRKGDEALGRLKARI